MHTLELLKELKRSGIKLLRNGTELRVRPVKGMVTPELLAEIRAHKDELIELLKGSENVNDPILPALPARDYPTTFQQQSIWILSQGPLGTAAYNMPLVVKLDARVNGEVLEQAILDMIGRHEVFRTYFVLDGDGNIRQKIGAISFRMERTNVAGMDETERRKLIYNESMERFDLEKAPLVRARLLHDNGLSVFFILTIHHIICDGSSLEILKEELFMAYEARMKSEMPVFPESTVTYKDVAVWEYNKRMNGAWRKEEEFWKNTLQGDWPVIQFGDNNRPTVKTSSGRHLSFEIPAGTRSGLEDFCKENNVSLFSGLLAGLNILLFKYTGCRDVVVGTVSSGRENISLQSVVGLLMNTLPVRTVVDPGCHFGDIVHRQQNILEGILSHQQLPFGYLVDLLNKKRDISRSPLFDIMVIYNDIIANDKNNSSLQNDFVVVQEDWRDISQFDITFSFFVSAATLCLRIEFNSDIYDGSTITRLVAHYRQLLGSLLQSPLIPVNKIGYLSEEETFRQLIEYNNTSVEYPANSTFLDLFAEQVRKTPGNKAVIFEGRTLLYSELDQNSNRLARYLQKQGVTMEMLVPVCMDRSLEMMVALFGILKAGGAYVPIDPAYPEGRIAYMLSDTGAKVIVTNSKYSSLMAIRQSQHVVCLDRDWPIIQAEAEDPVPVHPGPKNLAYVIYTSGSTGNPKGVMIEHRSLFNFLCSMLGQLEISEQSTLLAVTTYSFDIAYLELYLLLLAGGTVILLSRASASDAWLLSAELNHHRPSHMQATPSTWQMLIDAGWKNTGNMMILVGGEAINERLKDSLTASGGQKVFNLYGPTETTIWSTVQLLTLDEKAGIGKPISNTRIYLFDEDRQLIPAGMAGEIYIGGAGLARGYLNKEDLTGERFISCPYNSDRIYRTGDIGKWLPDGNLAYLGRKDHQVKIRGYRIEPGEIEHTLMALPGIDAAIVLARSDSNGSSFLVAYIIGQGRQSNSVLRKQLSENLPDYMVPGYFVRLDKMPLTPNGKIDRNALPVPDMVTAKNGIEFIPPGNPTEEKIGLIWQNALNLSRPIGVTEDFFDLGGHSLRMMQLVNQYVREFGVRIPMEELFRHTTIAAQASLIAGGYASKYVPIDKIPDAKDYQVSDGQRRIWMLSQTKDGSRAYNIPGWLYLEGDYDIRCLQNALQKVIERHEILRTEFFQNDSGEVRQVVVSAREQRIRLRYEDFRESTENQVREYITANTAATFDLSCAPLLRVALIRTGTRRYIFYCNMHHIIGDGWSLEILARELMMYYHDDVRGETRELPELAIQYKDYAAWKHRQLEGEVYNSHKEYWIQQFKGDLPVLELPISRVRPSKLSHQGYCISTLIDRDLADRLNVFCREQKGTLFMGLLGILDVLLYRYTQQNDIIIGSPVAGRERAELENQIGFYINTVAIRTRFSGDDNFEDILRNVRTAVLSAYEHQPYPFDRLIEDLQLRWDKSRSPLFDVTLTLHNQHGNDTPGDTMFIRDEGIVDIGDTPVKNDLHFGCQEVNDGIQLDLRFNTDVFGVTEMRRFLGHFKNIMRSLLDHPLGKVAEIDYLSTEEYNQLLTGFSSSIVPYPRDKTIVDIFCAQAARNPAHPAVVFEDRQLTYSELDERSDLLAFFLRQKGVAVGGKVVISAKKSAELIVGILGILKAGAAFVPVDPAFPPDRIRYIIDDTQSKVMIVGDDNLRQLLENGAQIDFLDLKRDWPVISIATTVSRPIGESSKPDQLVYVIYTSGSTGMPKGVMIEHRSLMDHVYGIIPAAGLESCRSFALLASLAADAYHSILFSALALGGCIHVISDEILLEGPLLVNYMDKHPIDCIKIFPSLWSTYAETEVRILPRQVLIFGGETFPVKILGYLREINYEGQVYNHYGPTETTIGALIYRVNPRQSYMRVPVGFPYSNTRVYIVDSGLKLSSVGVTGELLVGGDGLARGYLNKPELTLERFIDDPFRPGDRVYKTGDLARWLPDGSIEYMGRADDQVKINGYRVELGEIEFAMRQLEGIQSSVATVHDAQGIKKLVVYFTGEREQEPAALRSALGRSLPDYMLPDYFVRLNHMPLMSNGKVDRKSLPAPDAAYLEKNALYQPARNEKEQALLEAYKIVLKRLGVGINNNFFDIGGDSIKAISLVSTLKQMGYTVRTADVLKYPMLEDLSLRMNPAKPEAPQKAIEGMIPLTPVQSRFFQDGFDGKQHYNQSVLLQSKKWMDSSLLRQCLQMLAEHHDTLRMVFLNKEGHWVQYNSGIGEVLPDLKEYDLRMDQDQLSAMGGYCEKLQKSFNLQTGPLLKAAIFHLTDGDRLFLVAHHLVTDGISWRILLDDLSLMYRKLENAEDAVLPLKGSSFRQWAACLRQYADSSELALTLPYWQSVVQSIGARVPVDRPGGENVLKHSASVQFELDEVWTTLLLTGVNHVYNTDINDILLTALCLAVQHVFNRSGILVELEGHGREEIAADLHIQRTVGWFTALYPVWLNTVDTSMTTPSAHRPLSAVAENCLINVKEQLRKVPGKGIGYGILRYGKNGSAGQLNEMPDADIRFNYLGEFGEVSKNNGKALFTLSKEYHGEDTDPDYRPNTLLTVTGVVMDSCLSLDIRYSKGQYFDSTIQRLSVSYEQWLKELIESLKAEKQSYLTSSDLTYKGLSIEQLAADDNIEDAYELSPLQEGMYYHWFAVEGSTAYIEQMSFHIKGKLNVGLLRKSYEVLVARHAVLRTTFHHDYADVNIQLVRKKMKEDFRYKKLSPYQNGQIIDTDIKRQDLAEGFDLNKGPLMRLTVVELNAEDEYELVWSNHHILMDGWCRSILVHEFYNIYHQLSLNRRPLAGRIYPYADFIKWLSRHDRSMSELYWQKYLKGYGKMSELPFKKINPGKSYISAGEKMILSPEQVTSIRKLCAGAGITENTFLQSIWGFLLSRYDDTNDIVFGAVVSGRPADLEGVREMIGLFINTIPVRITYDDTMSCRDLLRKTQQEAIEGMPYHHLRLSDIQLQSELGNSLFDHIIVYENYLVQTSVPEDFALLGSDKVEQTNYDFNVIIEPAESSVEIHFRYNELCYSGESVRRISEHMRTLIHLFTGSPDTPLSEISYLSSSERHWLLEEVNDTREEYDQGVRLTDLFGRQVLERGEEIALEYRGEEYSYGELDELSNCLGRYIQERYGLEAGDLVGVRVGRGVGLVISLLGVLKTGCGYVPVDPGYPEERVSYIRSNSGYKGCIDEEELERFWSVRGGYSGKELRSAGDCRSVAYVMYTSGTTGQPKGCVLEHRGIVNRLEWMWRKYGFDHSDIILQKTRYTFDVSVWELFLPLCWGCRMVMSEQEDMYSPERLLEVIGGRGVTCVHFVPGLLDAFVGNLSGRAGRLSALRRVITSGEALGLGTLREWYSQSSVPVYNLYGPTEASIDVTYYDTRPGQSKVLIGRPVSNTQIYILDEGGRLVGRGVEGELYIGGVQVARGYINNGLLTAEKFVENPYRMGERMYRTGDRGRWTEEGEIEYLGRRDEQVKIRGYRIELGEVEHALEELEGIGSAVVVVREMGPERERSLVAYFTVSAGRGEGETGGWVSTELRRSLLEKLPEYMVPGYYVRMSELPLTANGKTDRKGLPSPETGLLGSGASYMGPRNAVERKMVEIWQELLRHREAIGIEEDFFAIGGHSLRAMQLVNHYYRWFDVKLSIEEVFRYRTIALQSERLSIQRGMSYKRICKVEEGPDYAVSDGQRRLWVLSQIGEGSRAYHLSGQERMRGEVRGELLERAINRVIGRHEILRTVFRENELGELRQVVLGVSESVFGLEQREGKELSEEEVKRYIEERSREGFDLSRGPLLRGGLVRVGEEESIFYYTLHHIISDGWSMEVLGREVLENYEQERSGQREERPELRIQYRDYAGWQQEQLKSGQLGVQREYWLGQLGGELPVLDLLPDRVRPGVATQNGYYIGTTIDGEVTEGLRRLCREEGSTLYMGLLSVLKGLLYRYTGQEDMIVGSPVAGRVHVELEDQLGFYVNTLALRTRVKGGESFRSLLRKVREVTLSGYAHQDYPFDRLVEELEIRRDLSRSALFDVMLILQNQRDGRTGVSMGKGLAGGGEEREGECAVKFDLTVDFTERGEGLNMGVEYNRDLYDKGRIVRLMDHYKRLLRGVLCSPDMELGEVEYLSSSERHWLLEEVNDTATDYPGEKTIVHLFKEQVARTPGKTAIMAETAQLSYLELDKRSNQLAHYLRRRGVREGSFVPICMDKSPELIVTILGILKAGGAYVPIDPDHPEEWITSMLSDIDSRIIIAHKHQKALSDAYRKLDKIYLDLERRLIDEESKEPPAVAIYPDSLAYVLYTSGSTGRPKGIMVEHRPVVRLVKNTGYLPLTGEEILLSTGSVSFDATTFEYWGMLLNGGLLVLCPQKVLMDVQELKQTITKYGVNVMWFTSGLLNHLVDMDISLFEKLKALLAGGDRLSPYHIKKLRSHYPALQIVNGYGPTENTTFSLCYQVRDNLGEQDIPIGHPISNSTAYIFDNNNKLVPIGVSGEIMVAGDGLARGYINNGLLTAEKFVENPYRMGERMYRTGDRGRWTEEGEIEYLGRRDEQVKIRGYRIELGEVEHALEELEGIGSAVVVVREMGPERERSLVAYFTVSAGRGEGETGGWVSTELRRSLLEKLPEYMVPGYYVRMSELPLTANGKTDRKGLPSPETGLLGSGASYTGPRNAVERKMVEIWQELLRHREAIGIEEDFFAIGGHSLRAMQLVNHYYRWFDVKLSIEEVFRYRTIALQSERLSIQRGVSYKRICKVEEGPDYAVSDGQRRLWVLSQIGEGSRAYHLSGQERMRGEVRGELLERAINRVIGRHEILRTVFRENELGELRQVVLGVSESVFGLEQREGKELSEEEVKRYIEERSREGFDLSRGPLLRGGLVRVGEEESIFYYTLHHIISDGWSMEVLGREVLENYEQERSGQREERPELRIQYRDYAGWQQEQLKSGQLGVQREYWLGQLGGELPVLDLLPDRVRPGVATQNGYYIGTTIDGEVTEGLRRLCREEGSTLYMGLLSVLKGLLYRYTGQEDMIVGSPVAGRVHVELEDQLGFYVNTLALRTRVKGGESFRSLLRKVREVTLSGYAHQDYPFDRLVEELEIRRDLSRSALFDVMLILQNQRDGRTGVSMGKGLAGGGEEREGECAVKFDLTVDFTERGEGLNMGVEYNRDLYDKGRIVRLMDHYKRLLRGVLCSPDMELGEVEYLSSSERHWLLEEVNDTREEYDQGVRLTDLFGRQVLERGEEIALEYRGEEYSYGELDELSNCLGRYIQERYGLEAGDLVGVRVGRGVGLVISLLGVLKTGCGYVPVDPGYPEERVSYIRSNSGYKGCIDEEELERFWSVRGGYSGKELRSAGDCRSVAYVMYTSGTTGQPKGCVLEHRGIVNRLEWMWRKYGFDHSDIILQKTRYTFDVSVWELFLPLCWGCRMVMSEQEDMYSPERLLEVIGGRGVTCVHFVPGLLDAFVGNLSGRAGRLSALRRVITSGEALGLGTLREWYSQSSVPVYNLYGPTEASIDVTYYDTRPGQSKVLIGRPVSNTQIYILDEGGRLVGRGVEGELYIGGVQVARGYINNGLLTAEKFVENPYRMGERMYRTGDRGRWTEEGEIEYLGRRDEQVKIRGYRIELGEVEHALEELEGIGSAVVVVREMGPERERSLVAYFTVSAGRGEGETGGWVSTELRRSLLEKLPEYMVPGYYVRMSELPLTANGKTDRKGLPSPETGLLGSGASYMGPRNAVERKMVEIWQELLRHREAIGIEEDFFAIGGHSLRAMQLVNHYYRWFDVKLSIEEVFRYRTIALQSQRIETLTNELLNISWFARAAGMEITSREMERIEV